MTANRSVSIRSRLLLLVVAVLLPALAAGLWVIREGWIYAAWLPRGALADSSLQAVLPLLLGAGVLLLVGIGTAVWIGGGIARSIDSLRVAAMDLQANRVLAVQPLGIRECDAVAVALTDSSAALRNVHDDLRGRVDAAAVSASATEQRAARSQHAEVLGRLTGGLAHEFNNLLGVINNSVHLIDRRTQDPEVTVLLASILRSVESGSRMTDHLLRIAGRQMLHPVRVELGEYLAEVRPLLQTVLGKRIDLSIRVAPATRAIQVDAGELELALINLALNAREAIAAKRPAKSLGGNDTWGRVELQAGNAPAEECTALPAGSYSEICMADDGRGMEEALVERVFEPFFTTKSMGEGTGLGLSQVQGFCVQAGGTAHVRSTPSVGTTVFLLLPSAPPAVDAPAIESAAATVPEAADKSFLIGKHVLVVDDNQELGAVTASLLAAFGCRVTRAADAQQALAAFGAGHAAIDMVLSDVVMPGGMDGIALAHALRRRYPALPLVLTSGYSRALAGGSPFVLLRKPATPGQLVAALRQATLADAAQRPSSMAS